MEMNGSLKSLLYDLSEYLSMGSESGCQFIYIGIVLFLAILSNGICNLLLRKILLPVVRRTKFDWDDYLYDKKVISRLAALVPAIVLYYLLPSAFPVGSEWAIMLNRICRVYIIALIIRFINGLLRALLDLASAKENWRHLPVKGGVQTVQVIVFCVGFICIIGIVIDQSPVRLLTGLSASAAVLMLVFRDTILGFVAGIQLSANNMLHKGDWITSPAHNANGYVQDVTLNTVKVLNFDQSTTTIPPYALVTGSFTNWRTMFESGGRRITRQLLIDVNTIKFLSEEQLQSYREHYLVGDFVSQRLQAIDEARKENKLFGLEELRVTNTLLFRTYLENYIRQMGTINHEMLYMVRYLPMEEKGLPIELYLFTKDREWTAHEAVLANLLDHTIAITAEFGLRLYQAPGSYDIQQWKERISGLPN